MFKYVLKSWKTCKQSQQCALFISNLSRLSSIVQPQEWFKSARASRTWQVVDDGMSERTNWRAKWSRGGLKLLTGSQQGHIHKACQSSVFTHLICANSTSFALCLLTLHLNLDLHLCTYRWHNVWICCIHLYFYLWPLFTSPSLLPADGQMDGTADLTLTFLLTLLSSTSLLRLAGNLSVVRLLADPDALRGHLLKSVKTNTFPNPSCSSIHSQWALSLCV